MATSRLIKAARSPSKARGLLRQADDRLDLLKGMDREKHATFIVEGYYEVIKELAVALLAVQGLKARNHRDLIEFLGSRGILQGNALVVTDELRRVRNRIAYEGLAVRPDYLRRRERIVRAIIARLRNRVADVT